MAYLQQALAVTTDARDVAELRFEIGSVAHYARNGRSRRRESRAAHAAFTALGDHAGIARASAVLGNILFFQGRIEPAAEMLESALAGIGSSDPHLDVRLRRQLARAEMFRSRPEKALAWVETGLTAAARLDDLDSIGDLMLTRAWAVGTLGRTRESIAEDRGALEFARTHGLIGVQLRAANNLATFLLDENPFEAIRIVEEATAIAERVGDREYLQKLAFIAVAMVWLGDWSGAEALVGRWLSDDAPNLDYMPLAASEALMLAWAGRRDEADALVQHDARAGIPVRGPPGLVRGPLTEVWVALAQRDFDRVDAAARRLDEVSQVIGLAWEAMTYQGLVAAERGDCAGGRQADREAVRDSHAI